jgi:hypothetical protein
MYLFNATQDGVIANFGVERLFNLIIFYLKRWRAQPAPSIILQ